MFITLTYIVIPYQYKLPVFFVINLTLVLNPITFIVILSIPIEGRE